MIFANAAGMMGGEQPRVNKCCCFPFTLKLCLQTWTYAKIISGLIIVVSLSPVVFNVKRHVFTQSSMYPLLGVLVVFLVVDIGSQIASIIGVHKKSYNTLRSFYYYEVFALITDFVLLPVILYTTNNEYDEVDVKQTVIILAVGLFYILVDVIIIAKVKKEIMKIHNKYDLSSVQD